VLEGIGCRWGKRGDGRVYSDCFGFQVVLVSATLPHEILEMTKKFMTDPIRILVKR
jgi:hypothetical protein